jgi:hypothetical protein
MESNGTSQLTTGATQVTPRPAPPVRPLTAVPAPWPTGADVDHALGAWGDYDRWDAHAAADAFGQGTDGAA